MPELNQKTCTPCRGGIPPMERDEAERYLESVNGWELLDDATRIKKSFKFPDYRQTFDFVSKVAELAEQENHHPDIFFGYGTARVEIQTHKIGGLHENDFILAAKIDAAAA
jgi:4a-hydroxytetrahydrobiopterin dehydratase